MSEDSVAAKDSPARPETPAPTELVRKPAAWRAAAVPTLAAAFLALLGPFVALGESQIKGIFSKWSDDCLVVVDIEDVPHKQERSVELILSGKPPKLLPLSFNAFKDNSIISISLLGNQVQQDKSARRLGMHPMANQTCPGLLCPHVIENPVGERVLFVLLQDLDSSFFLRFQVYFSQPLKDDDFLVFVEYKEKLEEGVCRIEPASLSNFYLRLSSVKKIFFAALLLFLAGCAIALFKRKAA